VSVSEATVQHVARLARLQLSAEKAPVVAGKMNDLVALFAVLESIDVTGVEPLFHPGDISLVLRPDQVSETDQRAQFQALAPEMHDDLYLVPKVIESAS
jgi:aspartyl-tRNA(Asn)/glutamyl-tRNA(Gln) amidotransferase subunit C